MSTLPNCTNNEITMDIILPTLLLTIPCGLSFLGLMSLLVNTLIKPLFKNKEILTFINQTFSYIYTDKYIIRSYMNMSN